MKNKKKYSSKTKMLAGGNQASITLNITENYNNSISVQCKRLLSWLQNGEHISTYECRKRGIMHPAARAQELRLKGYNIITHRTWENDSNGVAHYFAKYILISLTNGGAA